MSATAKISVVAAKGRKRIEVSADEMSSEELLKVAAYFFQQGVNRLRTERT